MRESNGKRGRRLSALALAALLPLWLAGCGQLAVTSSSEAKAAESAINGCSPGTSPPLPLDSLGDPYYPQLGNAGYDAQHYSLDLTADPASNTITGTATILAQAAQNLSAFSLDFHGLTVHDLTVDGEPAVYERQGDKLRITLPQPVSQGQIFSTTVAYSGQPGAVQSPATWRLLGWVQAGAGSYVSAEPSGAQGWYPVNDYPCDKATYDLRLTVPISLTAAANGQLVGTEDNGPTMTYLWHAREPIASYLVSVYVGDFTPYVEEGPGGLPIRSYYLKAVAADAARVFSDTTQEIAFFSNCFGPYPFEAYGVAVVDDALGDWAMENQTLPLFGRDVTRSGLAPSIGPHELAHQWFGNSVSLKSWRDIWLNEGFATYAEALWYEHVNGPAALEARMRGTYPGEGSTALLPPGNPPPDDLFNSSVYLRGALTLHALRRQVGDETFFRILRTYTDRYRYGNASTNDFIAVASEVSGHDLGAFFQAWLYNPAIPPYPGPQAGWILPLQPFRQSAPWPASPWP